MFDTVMSTTTTNNRRTGRRGDARERVLVAAIEEFAARGLAGASVRRICARAGANVAAVNYYFGSKDALYAAVFHRLFEDYGVPLRRLAEGIASEDAWRRAVRRWLELSLRWLTDDRPPWRWIARLIVQERAAPSAMCGYLVRHVFAPVRESFAELVKMGLPAGSGEAEVRLWVNTTMAQLLLYAQREPPWDQMLRPSGVSFSRWRRRVVEHLAGLLWMRLRYRAAGPRRSSAGRRRQA